MTVKKENGVMVLSTGYSDLSISTDYSVEWDGMPYITMKERWIAGWSYE
jgi:hypothetical protein